MSYLPYLPLSVVQCWENARQGGERGEVNFCDHKGLNMPTMRVTWEAKNQLKDLLVSCGFPEECFIPQEYNFNGPDPKLDMVVALLAMGEQHSLWIGLSRKDRC